LVAFARAFDRPVIYFLTPPSSLDHIAFQASWLSEEDSEEQTSAPVISSADLSVATIGNVVEETKDLAIRAWIDQHPDEIKQVREWLNEQQHAVEEGAQQFDQTLNDIEETGRKFEERLKRAEVASSRAEAASSQAEQVLQRARQILDTTERTAQSLIELERGFNEDDPRSVESVGQWIIANLVGEEEFKALKESHPSSWFVTATNFLIAGTEVAKQEARTEDGTDE
jgi:hypothetical protein